MRQISVSNFAEWRDAARALLAENVDPAAVLWSTAFDNQPPLTFAARSVPRPAAGNLRVPKRFLEIARAVACHRDPHRWSLLYRALYRIGNGERDLLEIEVDDDVRRLLLMQKAVRHDIHHMHAFVRFRRIEAEAGETYVAWYRPDHLILELAAPFFVERFGSMHWALLTPDACAYWDTLRLRFGPGVSRAEAPAEDALEDLWCDYYCAVFNPARLHPKLLKAELPVRHWATLPEARVIPGLVANASKRTQQMIDATPPSAKPFVPSTSNLTVLQAAVANCRGCDLYRCATQAVFGEGPSDARIVVVGEQPGDQEDLAGRPFVGPAGQLLDRALNDAGLTRGELYITNAVKHFKYEERGKRRIHQTPRGPEISACRPWIEAEIAAIKPRLIVCLGATAAQSLYRRALAVNRSRGRFQRHHLADLITVTLHPSALLRFPDPAQREREYQGFVADLRRIHAVLLHSEPHQLPAGTSSLP
jgi:DNA polymerase